MLKKIKPNHLTVLGGSLVPFMLISQQIGGATGLLICLILVLLREGTDIADGRLARSTGQITAFGKLFDPLVDSLARCSMFIAFAVSGWMPLWMAELIFARDIIVGYTRAFAASFGIVIAARASGKYIKAIPQAVAQCLTIFGYFLVECGANIPVKEISWVLLFVATVATTYTIADYGLSAAEQIKNKKEGK